MPSGELPQRAIADFRRRRRRRRHSFQRTEGLRVGRLSPGIHATNWTERQTDRRTDGRTGCNAAHLPRWTVTTQIEFTLDLFVTCRLRSGRTGVTLMLNLARRDGERGKRFWPLFPEKDAFPVFLLPAKGTAMLFLSFSKLRVHDNCI